MDKGKKVAISSLAAAVAILGSYVATSPHWQGTGTITTRKRKPVHLRTHMISEEVKPWVQSYGSNPLAP